MKIFSILVLGIALTACAPAVFDPSNGIPMGANETWNLKILTTAGKLQLDENYKLSGNFRNWSQIQSLPARGSNGLIEVPVADTYTTGLLKFYISPIESTQIANIRSDKHTGVITFNTSREVAYKRLQIFNDIYKTKAQQDYCTFTSYEDINHFQGSAGTYPDGDFGSSISTGTCTFTKLEPPVK